MLSLAVRATDTGFQQQKSAETGRYLSRCLSLLHEMYRWPPFNGASTRAGSLLASRAAASAANFSESDEPGCAQPEVSICPIASSQRWLQYVLSSGTAHLQAGSTLAVPRPDCSLLTTRCTFRTADATSPSRARFD